MIFPITIKGESNTDKVFIWLGMLVSVFCLLVAPGACIEKAIESKSEGDFYRFYVCVFLAVVIFAFCSAWVVGSIHLIAKKVIFVENGIEFNGLIKDFLEWNEIASAEIHQGLHSVALVLRDKNNKKYEVDVGSQEDLDACLAVLKMYDS